MTDSALGAKLKSTAPDSPEGRARLAAVVAQTRVFISYSRKDQEIACGIAKALRKKGIDALYDENLNAGDKFTEEIKNFIAHSHVFLPVLTKRSGASKWVQQEIGYAVALRVPVVPVAIKCDPGEFLHGIQAIRLPDKSLKLFRKWLSNGSLEECVVRVGDVPPLYECADNIDQRAVLIAAYAKAVASMKRYGKVRQLAGLSSFHIPTVPIHQDVWAKMYGTKGSSENHRRVLREERLALTNHAKNAGCKIIIDPDLSFDKYGGEARLTRLKLIRDFLRKMNDTSCQVALGKGIGENFLIVGDWFAARAFHRSGREGWSQTIFTRHAPTVKRMIADFDFDFAQALGNVKPRESRRHAKREIEKRIKQLEKDPEGTGQATV